MLQIEDLSVTYQGSSGSVYAVRNLTLFIEEHQSLGIVGESGSGKSTVALAILGVLPPQAIRQGHIFYQGKELQQKQEGQEFSPWREIGAVFQKSMDSFSPIHKIGKTLTDVYRSNYPGQTKEQAVAVAKQMLQMAQLTEEAFERYPFELSGGMLQRAAIAMGLICRPKLLILDEATTALDVITQRQILEEMAEMEHALGLTRLVITHDLSVVRHSCKKIAIMYAGALMEEGPTNEVLKAPQHPYTQALFRAHPTWKGPKNALREIRGSLPDLTHQMEGCVFAPRCEQAQKICRMAQPPRRGRKGQGSVFCHMEL